MRGEGAFQSGVRQSREPGKIVKREEGTECNPINSKASRVANISN
jgi:hypothetical protein